MTKLDSIQPMIPFQYQMTELDCVPTTLLNALRYLFRREEIPPEALIMINSKEMDEKSCWWEEERLLQALEAIIDWLNRYKDKERYKKFKVRATILQNEAVTPEKIGKYLQRGNAAVYMGVSTSEKPAEDHSTLAIFQDEAHVYLFDSYLLADKDIRKKSYHEKRGFLFLPGSTRGFNLAVPVSHLYSGSLNGDWYYRLGDADNRYAIVFERLWRPG